LAQAVRRYQCLQFRLVLLQHMYSHPGNYPVGIAPGQVIQQGAIPVPGNGMTYAGQAPMGYPAAYANQGIIHNPAVPLTPKMYSAPVGTMDGSTGGNKMMQPSSFQQIMVPRTMAGPVTVAAPTPMRQDQALLQKIHDLESALDQKDKYIKELQACMSKNGVKMPAKTAAQKARSPGRSPSGAIPKVADSRPSIQYGAIDQEDPIDVRLEEFYNATGSAIQFRRINRGFYRFGETTCELDIINHKLMARTEDGWNRGKYGPIEKFLMFYENIEREKAGISLEN